MRVRRTALLVPLVLGLVAFASAPAQAAHRTTLYPIPPGSAYPYGITVGPDGNMWFTEGGAE